MNLADEEALMRRRMAVVLLVGLGCSLAGGGAGAQTTTTTTTTVAGGIIFPPATTSTTAVNPCLGQPCTADPPVATLSGTGGNVRMTSFNFCWRDPVFAVDGPRSRCTIGALAPFESIPVGLVVRSGETLTLRFDTIMTPTAVALVRGDQTTALTARNPTESTASLPVGTYLVSFDTKWIQGDVGYLLKVEVRAATAGPATPRTGGPIALTG